MKSKKRILRPLSAWVCFSQRNLIREATAFLLDVLKSNQPEHGFLQTKVTFILHEFLFGFSLLYIRFHIAYITPSIFFIQTGS